MFARRMTRCVLLLLVALGLASAPSFAARKHHKRKKPPEPAKAEEVAEQDQPQEAEGLPRYPLYLALGETASAAPRSGDDFLRVFLAIRLLESRGTSRSVSPSGYSLAPMPASCAFAPKDAGHNYKQPLHYYAQHGQAVVLLFLTANPAHVKQSKPSPESHGLSFLPLYIPFASRQPEPYFRSWVVNLS